MTKLELKLLENRVIYILYNIFVLTLAFLLDRFLQMLMFILFFNFIMNCFKWRFHSDTICKNHIKATRLCKIITVCVETIFLCFCEKLIVSVYSNLFIIFSIAVVNCLLEFYLERTLSIKFSLSNQEFLERVCLEANISKINTQRLIMRYVQKLKIKEIADIENVEEDSINHALVRSRKQINKIMKKEGF